MKGVKMNQTDGRRKKKAQLYTSLSFEDVSTSTVMSLLMMVMTGVKADMYIRRGTLLVEAVMPHMVLR